MHIDKLNIERGKVVFILGASGCGKSTLLETLGLMNNTIIKGTINLCPTENAASVNIADLWKEKGHRSINQIRKQYYSFIFQNTNLMENFTAYENVCLSGMIKENVTQQDVLLVTKKLMERIKLSENDVNLETLSVNLSGGQRQRLSFVRALNTNASVLFCDEPTGNLDEANANELFEIIRENIINGISAIVVSHDINLALAHADQIIIISKDPAKGYGEIKDNNVFYRDNWTRDPQAEQEVRLRIRSLYNRDNEKNAPQQLKGNVNVKNTYKSLFFQKEGKALLGKNSINLFILTFILFFTFLAIGFGNGSLHYLHVKMSSAFVNWLTIKIPWKKADAKELKELQKKLNVDEVKQKYFFDNTSLYKEYPTLVWRPDNPNINDNKGEFRNVAGRTVDIINDAKLLNEYVLSDKNIVHGLKTGFKSQSDPAVIVTEKMLNDLNYKENARFLLMQYSIPDSTQPSGYRDLKIPVQIRAVVKELPGTYDVIYPMNFIYAFLSDKNDYFDIEKDKMDIHLFYSNGDNQKKKDLEKKLKKIIAGKPEIKPFSPDLDVTQDTLAYTGGYDFDISFVPVLPDIKLFDSFTRLVMNDPGLKDYASDLQRYYHYQVPTPDLENVEYDVMSVYFNKLDQVRDFADHFLTIANEKNDKVKIEVDTTKVKEKEDFNFLSNITYIISFLLIFFSAFAVCLFILNLLQTHLAKVKMNIGTFKAIGLSNNEARNIYFFIILFFVSVALIISFILASICGIFLDSLLTSNMHMEKVSYFKIFDFNTYLTIFIVLFSSITSCWLIINKMLSKTPGSPVIITLGFVRRPNISSIILVSLSRPIIGSILPSLASEILSTQNFSKAPPPLDG